MPSRGCKFITKFLVPSLNDKRFGTRLMWIDVEYSVFQVQWNHKSASDWTSYDAEVFMEWDKLKGRCRPDDREYYTQSKQRFRAIMYKMIKGQHITEICCEDKHTKLYCIGSGENLPSTIASAVISSGKNDMNENSIETIPTYDPEKIMDLGEISIESYIAENQNNSIVEDHKYARYKEQVVRDNKDILYGDQCEHFGLYDCSSIYIDIIVPEKIILKDSNALKPEEGFQAYSDVTQGFSADNTTYTDLNNNLKWEDENIEYPQYEDFISEVSQNTYN